MVTFSVTDGTFLYYGKLLSTRCAGNPHGDSASETNPLVNNLVDFTCRPSYSTRTFTVAVTVNLEDGMDRDEATRVGVKVFESSMGARYRLRSVRVDEQGIWKVKFDWGQKANLWDTGLRRSSIHSLELWFTIIASSLKGP